MNKNKGIWIVIMGILVIGILVTIMTASFVNRKERAGQAPELPVMSDQEEQPAFYSDVAEEESLPSQSLAASPVSPAEEKPFLSRRTEPGMLSALPEPEGAAEELPLPEAGAEANPAAAVPYSGEVLVEEADAAEPAALEDTAPAEPQPAVEEVAQAKAAEPLITPLSPDPKGRSTLVESTDAAAYYQKHMAELDGQIKKMREESADSNTYSMKALADKELRLWSRELNDIYASVSDCLDPEKREELEASQQKWIKERDSKAQAAGKRYSGGSLEGVEYTASLADSTRTRAYDLVAEYGEVLSEEEAQ